MKNKTALKLSLAILLEVVGALLLALILVLFLNTGMVDRQKTASEKKLTKIAELIEDMNQEGEAQTASFDAINTSKADTLAYMLKELKGFEATDSLMSDVKEATGVYNALVLSSDGKVVCSALNNPFDYTESRFNQLRQALTTGQASEPFTITMEDQSLRFYASPIDSSRLAVIVENTAELDKVLAYEASLGSILDDVHVGQDGIVVAISPLDYTFLYHPNTEKIGTSAVAAGVDVESLSDGVSGYMQVGETTYYCSTALIDDTYIVCAVPESEIIAHRNTTIILAVVIYLITASIMILYAFFARKDKTAPGEKKEYRRYLGGKLLVIGAVGLVVIFVACYLMETLFALSRQSTANSHRMTETQEALATNEEEKEFIQSEYNEAYLEKTRLLAYIVENAQAEDLTRRTMQDLASSLQVESTSYLDQDGQTVASSSSYWGFCLNDNEEDQSYEFWRILRGDTMEIVQDAAISDEGQYLQYIGVATQDADLKTTGLAQIAVLPGVLEQKLASTTLGDVLSGIQTGNEGFVFAVNAETGLFTYYPDSQLIGQEAVNFGMTETQLLPGFNDFITIDGTSYYCLSSDYQGELLYVAVPMATLNNMSLPIALVALGFCLIWMLLLWLYMILVVTPPAVTVEESLYADSSVDISGSREIIEVDRGDGKKIRTRSILSRFSTKGIPFEDMTAGQKVSSIMSILILVVCILFLIMILFADNIFPEDSLIHYILKGSWQKGFNIFAVTQCVILCVTITVVTTLIRRILMWCADKLNAKGETICRLICSFIKFGTLIGLFYVCLAQLGVDTSVLLTSAGILSLVVGLGANSLIKDILAGLMIVFEGTFQVGDIVTVSGFRGTVIEIGIRTTKVKEGGGNIKIFNNSSLGDVLNMTKDFSVVACDMSIEYGEDLYYVEKVLHREFPNIQKALPAIKDGPFYKGVSELGDNSVNIKIVAKCDEADRLQLDRDLRRELKLIFDKYGITIPFPQVVLNQPETNFHKASILDELEADHFKSEQGESSKQVISEGESQ